jgi:hypothetical protein
MKGNRSLFVVVGVIAVLILGWWLFRRGGGSSAIELVDRFAAAEKKPDAALFKIEDVTINGETKKSITVAPTVGTRLKFKVRVPDDGWLSVAVALKPEAWTLEGDGIRFMALASDGRSSDELFVQDINPLANQTDRKWIPLMVDLSAYAGEEVELMFNTYASPPGRPGDVRNDLAVWGRPARGAAARAGRNALVLQ